VGAAALTVLAGCGSSDSPVQKTFREGVAQIKAPQTAARLRDQLVRTLASLRSEHPSTVGEQRGKALAIRGFTATRLGIQARLDMAANDSGKLEAAVRDARRSSRYLDRGARLLRAAGRALEVQVGLLEGH
jgi:hypothetical protein